jgi:hypothetical protein
VSLVLPVVLLVFASVVLELEPVDEDMLPLSVELVDDGVELVAVLSVVPLDAQAASAIQRMARAM